MSNKRTRKILKAVVDRMNKIGIIHYFNDYNSFQLLQNKDTIIDFINNYYIDVNSYSDTHICIDNDLNILLNKL
nr:MAG TPA: hypothetical protein [Ackermannviridae sp.]